MVDAWISLVPWIKITLVLLDVYLISHWFSADVFINVKDWQWPTTKSISRIR